MIDHAEMVTAGQRSLADASGRIYGVVIGIVTDNQDPEEMARVKVSFPWLPNDTVSHWARIAVLMAGDDRGTVYLPEIDDEVLVALEHGDPQRPYVLGALWNGKDKPPETNADGQNNKRLIKSRSGMTILFDDTAGEEHIEIADDGGENIIVVDMANKKILITSDGDIEVSASKGTISISAKAVDVSAQTEINVKASGPLNLEGETVNIKGQPMVNIN